MSSIQLCFRNNFLRWYEKSGFQSLRAFSLASEVSHARAQKIAAGEFDTSPVGPGIFTVDRMCRTLGCTPNDLLGYETETVSPASHARKGEPSVEKLVQCYVRSAGHINGFSEYLHFCQIYGEPKDGQINLRLSGQLSLASRVAETTDIGYLQAQFFEFDEDHRRSVYEGQRRAWDRGIGLEAEFLNHDMKDRGRRARFDYLRAAFRVVMADGSEALLVYCALVDL